MNHFIELAEGSSIEIADFIAMLELPEWTHTTKLIEIISPQSNDMSEDDQSTITAIVVVESKNQLINCNKFDGTNEPLTITAPFKVVVDEYEELSSEPTDSCGGMMFNIELDVNLDRRVYAPLDFETGHMMKTIDVFFPHLFLTPQTWMLPEVNKPKLDN